MRVHGVEPIKGKLDFGMILSPTHWRLSKGGFGFIEGERAGERESGEVFSKVRVLPVKDAVRPPSDMFLSCKKISVLH